MNSLEILRMIAERVTAKLHEINQLSLSQWIDLSRALNVPANNRELAAKKLALRELRVEGKLA